MPKTTFKEKVANFFSCVIFFGVVIGVGAGSYYFYKRAQTKSSSGISQPSNDSEAAPIVPVTDSENDTPSLLAERAMGENLPLLWSDFGTQPVVLHPNLATIENIVQEKKGVFNAMQPAWKIADQICREIRSLQKERDQISGSPVPDGGDLKSKSASSADKKEVASRQEFFRKSSQNRWKAKTPERKRKIEALYQQLVAAEKAG